MRAMRHAVDIWPVGLGAARRNLTPILLFMAMAMLFAGGLYRLGGGTASLLILWLAGAYAAAVPLVAALRASASGGAVFGMAALSGSGAGSGAVHRGAWRALAILLLGGLLGLLALTAIFGAIEVPPARGAQLLGALRRALAAFFFDRAGPAAVAVAMALGWMAATLLLGPGLARSATRDLQEEPAESAETGAKEKRSPLSLIGLAGALLIGPAPLAALALWLDLIRPDAVEAGGYWTAIHALGEAAVFALAGLALTLSAVALENSAERREYKPS